nr:immunoglobulin heavy chain junction region [Macaca mulatta]MOX40737.1 immunoglobulin heavy chain junction region [Macaca mulatta]MOX41087.1 immunoglobulin heavy chain junction region [Macaca mulatta]MOX41104.1 immunoglobulin heavy chain junction region [Macaca mulatta]MOX41337.1 immunoglobulin heavy chain junction region [Macaca mulatta]
CASAPFGAVTSGWNLDLW